MRKVALVTGSGLRLGRAVALGLAEAGFDLAVHQREAPRRAGETARAVEALGRRALLLSGSIAAPGSLDAMTDEIARAFGRLDVMVAVPEIRLPGEGTALEPLVRLPSLATRGTADLLKASRGCVVTCLDLPGEGEGAMGLGAVTGLLARDLAPHVRVNAIIPAERTPGGTGGRRGGFRSGGRRHGGTMDDSVPGLPGPEIRGSPGDYAEVVRTLLFILASPYINGEVLTVGVRP